MGCSFPLLIKWALMNVLPRILVSGNTVGPSRALSPTSNGWIPPPFYPSSHQHTRETPHETSRRHSLAHNYRTSTRYHQTLKRLPNFRSFSLPSLIPPFPRTPAVQLGPKKGTGVYQSSENIKKKHNTKIDISRDITDCDPADVHGVPAVR